MCGDNGRLHRYSTVSQAYRKTHAGRARLRRSSGSMRKARNRHDKIGHLQYSLERDARVTNDGQFVSRFRACRLDGAGRQL